MHAAAAAPSLTCTHAVAVHSSNHGHRARLERAHRLLQPKHKRPAGTQGHGLVINNFEPETTRLHNPVQMHVPFSRFPFPPARNTHRNRQRERPWQSAASGLLPAAGPSPCISAPTSMPVQKCLPAPLSTICGAAGSGYSVARRNVGCSVSCMSCRQPSV